MARREIDSASIAKLVGVARSTVSKVINNYPNISEATRNKVLAAVREHQYYPDFSAQIMAGKRTLTIGLFFANHGHWSGDIHVSQMISSMIEHAADIGYHILTHIIRYPSDGQTPSTIKEVFYKRRIDAGIFLGFKNHDSTIEELIEEGFVIGVLDQHLSNREEPNRVVVNFDDSNCAASVIDYLASLGHREIAIINGDRDRNAGQARYIGYLEGLRRNQLSIEDDWVLFSDFGDDGAYETTKQFLARGGKLPTAIAAVNDSTAFGAIRALAEAGVRVPDDISIAGIDGQTLAAYTTPALTTFAFDFDSMLRTLVESVVHVLDNPDPGEPVRAVFPGRLVERESCRRV